MMSAPGLISPGGDVRRVSRRDHDLAMRSSRRRRSSRDAAMRFGTVGRGRPLRERGRAATRAETRCLTIVKCVVPAAPPQLLSVRIAATRTSAADCPRRMPQPLPAHLRGAATSRLALRAESLSHLGESFDGLGGRLPYCWQSLSAV